ncbi:hypothetical protein [Pseudomonas sp. R1-6]|uniref:hypothetical protein n=1 Tax=Pseudomonas sp. R1-6 TaxID=2817397 RepID=UPI003DA9CA5C
MFNKQEIKDGVKEYGKRWLFPDFTNKVTWLVVGAGVTILLTPTPLKVLFYNWVLDTANLNSVGHFTFADLKPDSADYIFGAVIIVAGLAHNILNRYFLYKEKTITEQPTEAFSPADKLLFEKFLAEFPSNSSSIHMLKHHDWGGSFNMDYLNDMEKFVTEWNTLEREFHSEELEEKRKSLWVVCDDFLTKLSLGAYQLHGPMYSCIPDLYRGTDNWPQHVDVKLKELSDLADQSWEMYRDFVQFGRKQFRC